MLTSTVAAGRRDSKQMLGTHLSVDCYDAGDYDDDDDDNHDDDDDHEKEEKPKQMLDIDERVHSMLVSWLQKIYNVVLIRERCRKN